MPDKDRVVADSNLNEPVIIQATRLDTSVLPRNIFSQSYLLYVIAQGTDVGNVANKANEAGKGAYDAQVKNDEQDATLADHESRIEAAEETLINHEHRIAAAESTLADHETRITAAETELADHEARIAANESELANHDVRITQNTDDIEALDTRLTAADGSISTLQSTVGDHSTRISALEYATTRKKSEVVYSGVSLTIPTAPTNLVSLLKTLTPSSGTLAPFFDTVNNKMVVFNENKTLFFKLSIVGTWPSGTANRSMQLTFSGSVPDTLVSSRNSATTTDNILLATFFSVDKDGFLATNGSTLTIQSNGAAFTATTIKIIAEQ
nr:tail needle knob protein [Escherichia coli]